MTAKKISQLPDLGAAPAATDELVIVDSGVTKKVSVEDLFTSINVTGAITTTAAAGNHTVFNSTGADADFRVRTGANTHSLYVEGNTGNVLVGKSNSSLSTSGFELFSSGVQWITAANTRPLLLNRTGSDGTIAEFRKDGTTVGNILSRSGVVSTIILDPRTGGRGLSAGSNSIAPTDQNGTLSNGATDIGEQNFKFRDLYLSGGVYLGGTGAANKLDDYEEGYFTATMAAGTGTITLDPLYDEMAYTKVGRVVHVQGQVIVGSVSTPSGTLRLAGLPFAIAAMTDLAERTAATVHVQLLTGSLAGSPMAWVVSGTELRIGDFDGTTFVDTMADHIAAGTQIAFSLTYSTDA